MSDKPLRDHLGLFELADRDRTWIATAACTGSSANFFPSRMGEPGIAEAMQICTTCPVRINCLRYALNNNIAHGIWGGYTARGRRELANALDYLKDNTRQEHQTVEWFTRYVFLNEQDPIRRTAQTLGMSKATVYHHLRIDRLAKEKTDELTKPENHHSD